MGYNVSKPRFNLAEFLAEKAPKRPYKRRGPYMASRGSEVPAPKEQAEDDEAEAVADPKALTDAANA
jgi:hypothetical protein